MRSCRFRVVLSARFHSHLTHLIGMSPSPLRPLSQIVRISRSKEKTGAAMDYDFLHRSHMARDHRGTARKRLSNGDRKIFIPLTEKNKESGVFNVGQRLSSGPLA